MTNKTSRKQLHVYVVQLFPPARQLLINFELPSKHSSKLSQLRRHKGLERAILRPDLAGSSEAMTTKGIKEYCSNLIAELVSAGYEPIAGGALHDNCWRTYVIHVDSPDSNSLYVGQTHYPVEIRFKQHQYGIRSARIFHKHEPHSLAYELFDGAPIIIKVRPLRLNKPWQIV